MIKHFIFIILLIQINQSPPKIVEGPGYKGTIFPMDYKKGVFRNPDEIRFTPTAEDVKLFEEVIRKQIRKINKNRINQGKGYGPVIHKNMSEYIRQYLGYVNDEGDSVLHVNFLKKSSVREFQDSTENWQTEWIIVFDGGSKYWTIDFNLNKNDLFYFRVNGIS